jgi:hypothetical protein
MGSLNIISMVRVTTPRTILDDISFQLRLCYSLKASISVVKMILSAPGDAGTYIMETDARGGVNEISAVAMVFDVPTV